MNLLATGNPTIAFNVTPKLINEQGDAYQAIEPAQKASTRAVWVCPSSSSSACVIGEMSPRS
jgi:hypothetical protein